MSSIKLIRSNIFPFIKEGEILGLKEKIKELDSSLVKGTCLGSSMTGWLNISSIIDKETIKDIKDTAEKIRNDFEAFIIIGIGGSYLGARAIIDFCKKDKEAPEIYFAGQNLSTDTLSELIEIIKTKKTALAVISKSGTTTEPAIAFRILKDELEKNVGKEESKKSIFIVTDKNDGLLRVIAEKEGYKTFSVPGNIGGRYCVLTAVGLFPASVAGADIEKILEGAKIGEEKYSSPDLRENPSYQYAATRNALYRKGKSIEILGFFSPYLSNTSEWWKQLTGESEGKKQRGIYPASASFSTDLHSLGQLIQEGERNIFETFLFIESSLNEVKVPTTKEDIDSLNYLAGKNLDYINKQAWLATTEAHKEGNVPNMTITLKDRNEETLGELFYFFERAIALSGLLLNVNPFDQPGVEAYKSKLFKLLGKK